MSAPAKPRAKSAKAAAKEAADAGSADGPLIVSSFVDHMKTKGMWAGALERVMIPDLLGAIPIPINVEAEVESGASSDNESDTASVAESVAASVAASAASASTSITEVADVQLIEIVHPHTPALLSVV